MFDPQDNGPTDAVRLDTRRIITLSESSLAQGATVRLDPATIVGSIQDPGNGIVTVIYVVGAHPAQIQIPMAQLTEAGRWILLGRR